MAPIVSPFVIMECLVEEEDCREDGVRMDVVLVKEEEDDDDMEMPRFCSGMREEEEAEEDDDVEYVEEIEAAMGSLSLLTGLGEK